MSFTSEFITKENTLETELGTTVKGIKEIKIKVKQRASKRQSLTKTLIAIRERPPQTLKDINFYIGKLKSLYQSLTQLDFEIESYMLGEDLWSDDKFSDHSVIAETYRDDLELALSDLNEKLKSVSSSDSVGHSVSKLDIPKLELPKFDVVSNVELVVTSRSLAYGDPARIQSLFSRFRFSISFPGKWNFYVLFTRFLRYKFR